MDNRGPLRRNVTYQALHQFLQQRDRFWSSVLFFVLVVIAIIKYGFPVVKEWYAFIKSRLEVRKLKEELRAAQKKKESLIVEATPADVERYDEKLRLIKAGIEREQRARPVAPPFAILSTILILIFGLTFFAYFLAHVVIQK
jgi:hypothetical protein